MEEQIRILAIVGSLRKGSHNRALLRAAIEVAPEGMSIEPYGDPPRVAAFKQALTDADGVLLVTPEYNYSTTGVLKNAIDWMNRGPKGSRGPRYSPMALKPVYIMGAASTSGGSARAQAHVREAMVEPSALVFNFPQVMVSRAQDKFDADNRLTDQQTRDFVALAMRAFASWIGLVGQRFANPHRVELEALHHIDPRRAT
jgi:chromate reductase